MGQFRDAVAEQAISSPPLAELQIRGKKQVGAQHFLRRNLARSRHQDTWHAHIRFQQITAHLSISCAFQKPSLMRTNSDRILLCLVPNSSCYACHSQRAKLLAKAGGICTVCVSCETIQLIPSNHTDVMLPNMLVASSMKHDFLVPTVQ